MKSLHVASRVATAQSLSWDLHPAACKHHTTWWGHWEEQLAATPITQDRHARSALVALAARLCVDCPVRAPCAERARTDDYSGIAAGAEYSKGHRHEPPPSAPPDQAEAS